MNIFLVWISIMALPFYSDTNDEIYFPGTANLLRVDMTARINSVRADDPAYAFGSISVQAAYVAEQYDRVFADIAFENVPRDIQLAFMDCYTLCGPYSDLYNMLYALDDDWIEKIFVFAAAIGNTLAMHNIWVKYNLNIAAAFIKYRHINYPSESMQVIINAMRRTDRIDFAYVLCRRRAYVNTVFKICNHADTLPFALAVAAAVGRQYKMACKIIDNRPYAPAHMQNKMLGIAIVRARRDLLAAFKAAYGINYGDSGIRNVICKYRHASALGADLYRELKRA